MAFFLAHDINSSVSRAHHSRVCRSLHNLGLDLPRHPSGDSNAAAVSHGGDAISDRRRHSLHRLDFQRRAVSPVIRKLASHPAHRRAVVALRQWWRHVGREVRRFKPRCAPGCDGTVVGRDFQLGSQSQTTECESVTRNLRRTRGVALLVSDGLGQSEKTGLISAGVVLLSLLAWASGSVYSNRNPIDAPTSMASGMQMLAGGGWLFLLALVTGDVKRLNLEHASWTSIGAFAYLTIFGSLVVFTAYSWLLKNVTPARAATYAYVNPVVAVLLGWSIAAEPLTSKMILAAAIIV